MRTLHSFPLDRWIFSCKGGKAEGNPICITIMHVLKSTHKSMVWLDLYYNDEDK